MVSSQEEFAMVSLGVLGVLGYQGIEFMGTRVLGIGFMGIRVRGLGCRFETGVWSVDSEDFRRSALRKAV